MTKNHLGRFFSIERVLEMHAETRENVHSQNPVRVTVPSTFVNFTVAFRRPNIYNSAGLYRNGPI